MSGINQFSQVSNIIKLNGFDSIQKQTFDSIPKIFHFSECKSFYVDVDGK